MKMERLSPDAEATFEASVLPMLKEQAYELREASLLLKVQGATDAEIVRMIAEVVIKRYPNKEAWSLILGYLVFMESKNRT